MLRDMDKIREKAMRRFGLAFALCWAALVPSEAILILMRSCTIHPAPTSPLQG